MRRRPTAPRSKPSVRQGADLDRWNVERRPADPRVTSPSASCVAAPRGHGDGDLLGQSCRDQELFPARDVAPARRRSARPAAVAVAPRFELDGVHRARCVGEVRATTAAEITLAIVLLASWQRRWAGSCRRAADVIPGHHGRVGRIQGSRPLRATARDWRRTARNRMPDRPTPNHFQECSRLSRRTVTAFAPVGRFAAFTTNTPLIRKRSGMPKWPTEPVPAAHRPTTGSPTGAAALRQLEHCPEFSPAQLRIRCSVVLVA
jgi:hypothetical protein